MRKDPSMASNHRRKPWFDSALLCAVGLLSAIIWLSPGCSKIDKFQQQIDDALQIVNNGIDAIHADSTRWQSIVQDVANRLPQELQSTVRVEVDQLVQRSIAQAGEEFRCNVDFLGNRAIAHLERIKALLLKRTPPLIEPAFCHVTPSAIDLNLAGNRRSVVDVNGYDLDVQDQRRRPVRVLLESADGRTRIDLPESRIGRTTHYHMTLNVSGPDFDNLIQTHNVAKIRLVWGDRLDGLPQILIIKAIAARKSLPAPIGQITHVPRRTNGDGDFNVKDDRPTDVRVIGETRLRNGVIEARAYMYAKERRPDNTTVESWSNEVQNGTRDVHAGPVVVRMPNFTDGPWQVAYRPPDGWRIVSANPLGQCEARVTVTDHNAKFVAKSPGEVVGRFDIYVDRDGDEAGSYTNVKVNFNDATVNLEEVR